MKLPALLIILFFTVSCNNTAPGEETAKKEVVVITNDTIPKTRTEVNKKSIASFSKKVPDELNDWHFAVDVYETKETFHYLMKIQYMELRATDTLKIPNFGMRPKIEIRPGKEKYDCIVGFFSKDKQFMEYKEVVVKGDNLKIIILHHYAVSTFQDEKK